MSQSATYKGIVKEKLETAINICYTMVSSSKEARKKIKSSDGDHSSLKKSLKELDSMSIELIDRLSEVNARIDLLSRENNPAKGRHNKVQQWLGRLYKSFRESIEKMKFAYQDMLSL